MNASDDVPSVAVVLDATGLRCPLPVIRLADAARDLPAGSLVEVHTTDPAAEWDIPAWCRMRGHALVGQEPAPGGSGLVTLVRLAD